MFRIFHTRRVQIAPSTLVLTGIVWRLACRSHGSTTPWTFACFANKWHLTRCGRKASWGLTQQQLTVFLDQATVGWHVVQTTRRRTKHYNKPTFMPVMCNASDPTFEVMIHGILLQLKASILVRGKKSPVVCDVEHGQTSGSSQFRH